MIDPIERQAAIDALSKAGLINYAATGDGNGMIQAVNVIKGLPPAQPKRGRWEKVKGIEGAYDFRCSACHRFRFHNGEYLRKYNFCPNCGADMRERSEDE